MQRARLDGFQPQGGFLVIGRVLDDPLRKLAGDPVQFAVEATVGDGALAGLVSGNELP